ncbi:hypothetical protein Tco_0319501 [Tanacetum coccineum]
MDESMGLDRRVFEIRVGYWSDEVTGDVEIVDAPCNLSYLRGVAVGEDDKSGLCADPAETAELYSESRSIRYLRVEDYVGSGDRHSPVFLVGVLVCGVIVLGGVGALGGVEQGCVGERGGCGLENAGGLVKGWGVLLECLECVGGIGDGIIG